MIARVTAQTCRQSGLSVIYTELLDFDGVEIYLKEEKSLMGKSFKECMYMYEDSSLIGILFANGSVIINPPMNTKIQEKDVLIFISEDDDTITLSGKTNFNIKENVILSKKSPGLKKEKTLILGWNEKGIRIIQELDSYVGKGSEIKIVSELETTDSEIEAISGLIKKQKIEVVNANITDRIFFRISKYI